MTIVESTHDELARRHRSAVKFIGAMLTLTLLLIVIALSGAFASLTGLSDPTLVVALRITIVLFSIGAVAFRRTRFAPARLQDIASLEGASGLLATLEKTTVLVALLGGAIAVMGFLITLMTGDRSEMLWLGLIPIAVLVYCYPRRSAWQRVVQLTRQENAAQVAPPAKGTPA